MVLLDEDLEERLRVITSHVYSSFHYCLRQGWYAAHRMVGEETNEWMARGRLYEDLVKKRGHRQVYILGSVMDIAEDTSRGVKVVEVKASKGSMQRGIHQAEFFLFLLYLTGVENAIAEVYIPSSRQRVEISPTPEMYEKVYKHLNFFYDLVRDFPPRVSPGSQCHACSYRHLCWG